MPRSRCLRSRTVKQTIGMRNTVVAAGTMLFLIPILVFTVLLRKHLLRGITFGAVRK